MKVFYIISICLSAVLAHGQNAILSSGKWYKISVSADGVYKIDYDFLKRAGFNPDQIDPNKIQLFGGLNGMLPQPNNVSRPVDLNELSIYVSGADDGKFNSGDYILFFGQGPDTYQLLTKGFFSYQNNLFTDKNFYFLTVGANSGKRMTTVNNIAGTFPVVSEFDDFGYYETEQHSELHSGRDWFGELFDTKTEYTVRFEIPGIIDGTPITLISGIMGQSFDVSSMQFLLNDVSLFQQSIPPISNSQYTDKGVKVADTLTVNATNTGSASRTNQDVKLRFTKASSGRSVAYLDYLLLQTKRKLALYDDQTGFQSLKSLDQVVTQYTLTNVPSIGMIFDITDPFNVKIQQATFGTSSTTFSATSDVLKKFIVTKNYKAPGEEGNVINQNIHGITSINLLVVTAQEFVTEAQRLADYRRSKNSLNTAVVTTQQVYNEFSGGKQDVTAIRDMVRFLYNKNTGLKSLLLFGRGSYDYRNYLPNNKNFVPIYESRNSLSPLETYSSDDYYGFLETNEGRWNENPAEDHTLEIGVGRFPVKKLEEAQNLVDKLIEYENQNWGDWRKDILFVADDGDFNIHQSQADQLAQLTEVNHPEFNTQKIYLDDFKQVNSSIGQVSPDATTALSRAVSDGVAIVNYTGHGSELQLMQERILDQISLDKWKTEPRYPLLVTATCEFGRSDDPDLISTSELGMLRKKAGWIGLVTTARPVNSSTNFTLNTAFYQSLFTKNLNKFRDLGTIFKDTKNNSLSGVSNRNFSLLADPSMYLATPNSDIQISSVTNLTSGSDTLKALSKVQIKGNILTNGIPNSSFQGTLEATLFDKLIQHTTQGDENPPFNFTAHDNVVFRGRASVSGGQFTVEFILPKSMDPTVSLGKLSLYAYSKSNASDVTGQNSLLKIGSAEKNPGVDNTGPGIELFMGDSTFVSGGITGTNTRIVAILTDNNGINVSGFAPQNDITAILDDTLTVILNNYYEADVNNYKRGKVNYAINNLKPGNHKLSLRASDTFGNLSSSAITFYVSDQGGIQIEQLINYPNPVNTYTTFHFKHNRSGEDLEAMVTIFDTTGKPMLNNTYQITNSSYQVDLPQWDGTYDNGTKLSGGLYLLKLSLRSLLDGSKNEKITKVIISN